MQYPGWPNRLELISVKIRGAIFFEFGGIYQRLVRVFPNKPWLRAVADTEALVQQFPGRGIQEQLEQEVAFGLAFWERNGYLTPEGYQWRVLYHAMYFSRRLVDLIEAGEANGGRVGLRERFMGALKLPSDMRALQFELYIANQLEMRGCRIEWPDECAGEETFDLLVHPPEGGPTFELECKSFAGDKGGVVHLKEAHRLLGALASSTKLGPLLPCRDGYASILTIRIAERLPSRDGQFKTLVNNLVEIIERGGGESKCKGVSVAVEFAPLVGDLDDMDVCFNAASRLSGDLAAFYACAEDEDRFKGVRVVADRPSKLWKEVVVISKRAFQEQLTGKRPGALALQLTSESDDSFLTVFESGNRYERLSEKLIKDYNALMLLVTNDTNLSVACHCVPFRSDAFMEERAIMFAMLNPEHDQYTIALESMIAMLCEAQERTDQGFVDRGVYGE